MPSNTVFILDDYNQYGLDKDNVRTTIKINGRFWAIKEVQLQWGLPQLQRPITDPEIDPYIYKLYNTYEEAFAALQHIKALNRDR